MFDHNTSNPSGLPNRTGALRKFSNEVTMHFCGLKAWLRMAKLDLVDEKTEAVLITNRRKNSTVKIRVGNHEVVSQSLIRYLGVMVDTKLNFEGHLNYARGKGGEESSFPARPKYSRRLHIAGVMKSILLYVAPVWAIVLDIMLNQNRANLLVNEAQCYYQKRRANQTNVTADF